MTSRAPAFVLAVLLFPGAVFAALSWSDRAPVLPSRGHHAGGTLGGKIYVAGGGFFGGSLWGSTESAQVYDPLTNTWALIAPMPVDPIFATAKRTFATGAVATKDTPNGPEDRFYVIGGVDLTDLASGDVWGLNSILEYDPGTNTWRQVPTPIPTLSVGGLKAATVGNKIYVVGGFDDLFAGLSDSVLVYDPNDPAEAIVPYGDPMPSLNGVDVGWSDGAVAVHGTSIYWFDGYFAAYGNPPSNVTLIFDTTTGTWTQGTPPPIPIGSPPGQGRADGAAITYGDTIYLVGGWDGSLFTWPDVFAYDVPSDTWRTETDVNCMPRNPADRSTQGRAGLTLHLADDGTGLHLYAVGGSLGISVQLDCHEYTALGGTTDVTPPDFSAPKEAHETTACPTAPEVTLTWGPAVDAESPPVAYNVYRSKTDPAFVPSPANRIATAIPDEFYVDTDVACGETVHYVVRAQDSAVPPNEDTNLDRLDAALACPPPDPPTPLWDELRLRMDPASPRQNPILDWSLWSPAPEVTHAHVYRSPDLVPFPWVKLSPEGGSAPYENFRDTTDQLLRRPVLYYQVRPALGCQDTESLE